MKKIVIKSITSIICAIIAIVPSFWAGKEITKKEFYNTVSPVINVQVGDYIGSIEQMVEDIENLSSENNDLRQEIAQLEEQIDSLENDKIVIKDLEKTDRDVIESKWLDSFPYIEKIGDSNLSSFASDGEYRWIELKHAMMMSLELQESNQISKSVGENGCFQISYKLDRKYDTFSALLYSDEYDTEGIVTVNIYTDGKKIWNYDMISGSREVHLECSVKDADILTIEAVGTIVGDGIWGTEKNKILFNQAKLK